MDNITHGLAGLLLAQAGFRQRYGAVATVALVVGVELPDMDAVFALGGPVMEFVHHRGITHSIVGGIGIALLGAAGIYGLRRQLSYWRLVGLVYLGVLLHIWMDYLTSYGTQVLLPFDAGHYTADAVFIIDYFYSGIMIAALLLIRMVRRQQQRRYAIASFWWLVFGVILWAIAPRLVPGQLMLLAVQGAGLHIAIFAALIALAAWRGKRWQAQHSLHIGRCGVLTLAAYMGLCIGYGTLARQQFINVLGPRMDTVQRVTTLPQPGSAFKWCGIAETPTAYLMSPITIVPPAVVLPPAVVAKGPEHSLVRATSAYRLVNVFKDFARFPVVEYQNSTSTQLVHYYDLRFNGCGYARGWFNLTVHFDTTNQVQGITFLRRFFPPLHPDF